MGRSNRLKAGLHTAVHRNSLTRTLHARAFGHGSLLGLTMGRFQNAHKGRQGQADGFDPLVHLPNQGVRAHADKMPIPLQRFLAEGRFFGGAKMILTITRQQFAYDYRCA